MATILTKEQQIAYAVESIKIAMQVRHWAGRDFWVAQLRKLDELKDSTPTERSSCEQHTVRSL